MPDHKYRETVFRDHAKPAILQGPRLLKSIEVIGMKTTYFKICRKKKRLSRTRRVIKLIGGI